MALVKFTSILRQVFPELKTCEYQGKTLGEVLGSINAAHPGVRAHLLDVRNAIRPHVNVFVDQKKVDNENGLDTHVAEHSVIHVFHAVSGG